MIFLIKGNAISQIYFAVIETQVKGKIKYKVKEHLGPEIPKEICQKQLR